MSATAATVVRPRGLAPVWAGAAVAFLLVALAIGVLVGPVDLGLAGVWSSSASACTYRA